MPALTSPYVYRIGTARVYTAATPGVDPDPDNPHWTQQPYLYVDRLTLSAAPGIDQCVMTYDLGDFVSREPDQWGQTTPGGFFNELAVNMQFVKVEILAKPDAGSAAPAEATISFTWYGVVEASEQTTAQKPTDAFNKTGRQRLVAYGMLRLMESVIIDSSVVLTEAVDEIKIGRGLPFNYNSQSGYDRYGNVTPVLSNGVKIFEWLPQSLRDEGEDNEDDYWDADLAVRYLLKHHAPKDDAGDDLCVWEAEPETGGRGNQLPCYWYDISVDTDRRSVKDVLDDLLDRRRMLGYWAYGVEENDEFKVKLNIFTFTETEVILPDGEAIPANPNVVDLITGSSTLVEEIRITESAAHLVDEVIAEGAYITSTITLGVGENEAAVVELTEGWTDDQEDDYRAGAGGDAEDNTKSRARDTLSHVFSRFRIDTTWPATVAHNDQQYRVTIDPLTLPDDFPDELVEAMFNTENSDEWPWAYHYRPFLEWLPVRHPESKEVFRPFVLFAEGGGSYSLSENLGAVEGRVFGVTVFLLTETMGVRLEVNQPGGQQLIASANWAGAAATPDDLDPATADNQALDYNDMLVTATVEWDEKLRLSQTIGTATGQKRTVIISVPDARLDFRLPGTVKGLNDDNTLDQSTGEVLRDDRQRLQKILEAAAVWYGTSRMAATIPFADLDPSFVEIGHLVRRLWGTSDTPINTPVTGIDFDFVRGTTTVETSYAELDFATVARGQTGERA